MEVRPIFTLSLDRAQIDFGPVEPGKTKILGEGSYFNEIRCRSNYGRTWYLKAEVISGPKIIGEDFIIPEGTFSYKVVSAEAESEPKGKFDFVPLVKKSDVIYTSFGAENIGKEAVLRFQYKFEPPANAPSGTYTVEVLFTLVDTP